MVFLWKMNFPEDIILFYCFAKSNIVYAQGMAKLEKGGIIAN